MKHNAILLISFVYVSHSRLERWLRIKHWLFYLSRGPNSQHPNGSSQPSVLIPSSGLHRHQIQEVQRYACRPNTHTEKIRTFTAAQPGSPRELRDWAGGPLPSKLEIRIRFVSKNHFEDNWEKYSTIT